MHPFLTLGEEMFTSSICTPGTALNLDAASAYSSMVCPAMLTMQAHFLVRRKGIFSAINLSMPILARPMAFSIPAGVSKVLGGGWPGLGFRVKVLETMAPIWFM